MAWLIGLITVMVRADCTSVLTPIPYQPTEVPFSLDPLSAVIDQFITNQNPDGCPLTDSSCSIGLGACGGAQGDATNYLGFRDTSTGVFGDTPTFMIVRADSGSAEAPDYLVFRNQSDNADADFLVIRNTSGGVFGETPDFLVFKNASSQQGAADFMVFRNASGGVFEDVADYVVYKNYTAGLFGDAPDFFVHRNNTLVQRNSSMELLFAGTPDFLVLRNESAGVFSNPPQVLFSRNASGVVLVGQPDASGAVLQGPPDHLVIRNASSLFSMTLFTDFSAGYSETVCVECSNGQQTVIQDFQITQGPSCAHLTGPMPFETSVLQDLGQNEQQLIAPMTDLFSEHLDCPLTFCGLFEQDCLTLDDQVLVRLDNDGLWSSASFTDPTTLNLCVICESNQEIITNDQITVTQMIDCTSVLTPIPNQPTEVPFSQYPLSAVIDQFITNQNPDGCPLTDSSCSIGLGACGGAQGDATNYLGFRDTSTGVFGKTPTFMISRADSGFGEAPDYLVFRNQSESATNFLVIRDITGGVFSETPDLLVLRNSSSMTSVPYLVFRNTTGGAFEDLADYLVYKNYSAEAGGDFGETPNFLVMRNETVGDLGDTPDFLVLRNDSATGPFINPPDLLFFRNASGFVFGDQPDSLVIRNASPLFNLTLFTNFSAGYSETVCLECSNEQQTVTTDFEITQAPSCAHLAMPLPFETSVYLSNDLNETLIANLTDLFTEHIDCPLISCGLYEQDCLTSLMDQGLVWMDNDTHGLWASVNFTEFTNFNLCVSCVSNEETINNDQITVNQLLVDCQSEVSLNLTASQEYNFGYSLGSQVLGDHSMLFSNNDTVQCPLESCQLLTEGCLLPYAGGELTISGQSPFEVTASLNNSRGYNHTVCVECMFGGSALYSDGLTVVQRFDCSSKVSLNNPANQEYDFNEYLVDQVVGDNSLFFSNKDKVNCPVESCQLMQDGCLLPYQGEQLTIWGQSPFEVTASVNSSVGYLESVCIECTFGGSLLLSDGFSVLQRVKLNTFGQQLVNSIPEFESPLLSEIWINISEDVFGDRNDTSDFKYTSPRATDADGQPIQMSFSGLDGLPFVQLKQFDDTFTLRLRRDLMSEASNGLYSLWVSLGDEIQSASSRHLIYISINFLPFGSQDDQKYLTDLYDYYQELLGLSNTTDLTQNEGNLTDVYEYSYYDYTSSNQTNNVATEDILSQPDTTGETSGPVQELTTQEKLTQIADIKVKQAKMETVKRLKDSGLVLEKGVGFTFPSADLSQIKQVKEDLPPPKMSIRPVTSTGEIGVDFDQDMIYPSTIDQDIYGSLFDVSIESGLDETVLYGRFGRQSNRRQLAEGEVDNGFLIYITEHSIRGITMKTVFDNPEDVSSISMDTLSLIVKEPDVFKSVNLKPINGGQVLEKPIPPILASDEEQAKLASIANTAGIILSLFFVGIFLMDLVMGYSMCLLWTMTRAIQLLVFSFLVQVSLPAHSFFFFKLTTEFIHMDIFQGKSMFAALFTFQRSDPINAEFGFFGFETLNFLLNSGSFFFAQIAIIMYIAAKKFLNRLALKNVDKQWARKLGPMVYSKDYSGDTKKGYIKLMMESQLLLSFCAVLNMVALARASEEGTLGLHFSSVGDVISSISTIFYVLVLVLFPGWGFYSIIKNKDSLNTVSMRKKAFSVFTDNLRTGSLGQSLFNVFFLLRRVITVLILVLITWPYAQAQLLMITSTVSLIYLCTNLPFKAVLHNRLEVFNEASILLCSYIISALLDIDIHIDSRNKLGWVAMGIALTCLIVNVAFISKESFLRAYKVFKENKRSKQAAAQLKHKLDSLTLLVATHKNTFKTFQQELTIHEAVTYCKAWFVTRNWLLQNKVNISEFEEEKIFKQYDLQHQLTARAYDIKLTQTLYQSSEKIAMANKRRKTILQRQLKREEEATQQFNMLFVQQTLETEEVAVGIDSARTKSPVDLDLTPRKTIKQIKVAQFSKKHTLTAIKEEEREWENTQTNPTPANGFNQMTKNSIFKAMVASNPQLADFKPRGNAFKFNTKKDLQKLEELNNGPTKNKFTSNILAQEQAGFADKVFNEAIDLQFLVNNIEELKDEFDNNGDLTVNKTEEVSYYDSSSRIVFLRGDTTETGVLSAVLQILVELKSWATFFRETVFDSETQPLSTALNQFYTQALDKAEQLIPGVKVDISDLANLVQDDTPSNFMFSLQTALLIELGEEEQDTIGIFGAQFGWSSTTTHACSQKHKDVHKAEQQIVRLDIGGDLTSSFKTWLQSSEPHHPCLEDGCSRAITSSKVAIKSVAQTLMLIVDPEPVGPCPSFPLDLDLSEFRPNTKLRLHGMICSTADGYSTVIKKRSLWLKFGRDTQRIEVENDVAACRPVLLIYEA